MVAECMQVVPINFEKSRRSLGLARGGGRWRLRGACGPIIGVVNKGCFYKQTPEPLLSNVYDGA